MEKSKEPSRRRRPQHGAEAAADLEGRSGHSTIGDNQRLPGASGHEARAKGSSHLYQKSFSSHDPLEGSVSSLNSSTPSVGEYDVHKTLSPCDKLARNQERNVARRSSGELFPPKHRQNAPSRSRSPNRNRTNYSNIERGESSIPTIEQRGKSAQSSNIDSTTELPDGYDGQSGGGNNSQFKASRSAIGDKMPPLPPAFRALTRYGSTGELPSMNKGAPASPRRHASDLSAQPRRMIDRRWSGEIGTLKAERIFPPQRSSQGQRPNKTSPDMLQSNPSSKFSLPPPPPPSTDPFYSPVSKTRIERKLGDYGGLPLSLHSGSAFECEPHWKSSNNNFRATLSSPSKPLSDDEDEDIIGSDGESGSLPVQAVLENGSPFPPESRPGGIRIRPILRTEQGRSAATSSDHDRRPKKPWNVEPDLALLPPAFRTIILSMARKNSPPEIAKPSPPPPTPTVRACSDPHASLRRDLENAPSIADRKKLLNSHIKVHPEVVHHEVQNEPQPPAKSAEEQRLAELYARHGVVMYMRPDGLGNAAKRKVEEDDISVTAKLDDMDDPFNDENYELLLAEIMQCSLSDKANRAGKVLKRMKENSIPVSDNTLKLLIACTHVPEPEREPMPHEVAIEVVDVPPEDDENFRTPTQVQRKRVRFAETNSFRIIRRRRSIGSNERWDDPLTPPKRVSAPVDLAPARFSSGLRDNRPSLPRRSDSMSSLMSTSSHSSVSSHRSDSSGESEDDSSNGKSNVDRFKLPFPGSPKIDRKAPTSSSQRTTEASDSPTKPVQKEGIGRRPSPGRNNSLDLPSYPARRRSKAKPSEFLSPKPPLAPGSTSAIVAISNVPPLGSSMSIPPPVRRPIRRRRSISGTERRADTPLTPPRRVSAQSDLYSVQDSLRQAAKSGGLSPKLYSVPQSPHPKKIAAEKEAANKKSAILATKALHLVSDSISETHSLDEESPSTEKSPLEAPKASPHEGSDVVPTGPAKEEISSPKQNTHKGGLAKSDSFETVGTEYTLSLSELSINDSPRNSLPRKAKSFDRAHAAAIQRRGIARRTVPPETTPSNSEWVGPRQHHLDRHKEKITEHWKRLVFQDMEDSVHEGIDTSERSQGTNSRGGSRAGRRDLATGSSTINYRARTKPAETPSWAEIRSRATTQSLQITQKGGSMGGNNLEGGDPNWSQDGRNNSSSTEVDVIAYGNTSNSALGESSKKERRVRRARRNSLPI